MQYKFTMSETRLFIADYFPYGYFNFTFNTLVLAPVLQLQLKFRGAGLLTIVSVICFVYVCFLKAVPSPGIRARSPSVDSSTGVATYDINDINIVLHTVKRLFSVSDKKSCQFFPITAFFFHFSIRNRKETPLPSS